MSLQRRQMRLKAEPWGGLGGVSLGVLERASARHGIRQLNFFNNLKF